MKKESDNPELHRLDCSGVNENDEVDYQCGIGSCRPGCMQGCANIKVFTAFVSFISIVGSMNFTYYTAVITQIEKVYGLSSAMTGFIKNIDNIGYMALILLVSHFLRYSNKPRVFSISAAVTGFAVALFGLPHFIYGSDYVVLSELPNITAAESINPELCHISNYSSIEDTGCISRNVLAPFNLGALIIFSVSEILQGMAQSPKFTLSITHMDDNAKKNSPFYYGILFGVRSFAPLLGFMLGAWTTKIYVDLSDPGFGPRDPRWVGAWWIGFLICGLCTLVLAPPMALFPPKFKDKKADGEKGTTEQGYRKDLKISESAKDMPKTIWLILRNPVVITCVLAVCFNFYLIGFSTFTPKYLETQYGMTASNANMITAVVSGLSYCLGPIISGYVVTKIKISVSRSLVFILAVNIISCIGFIIMSFLGCESPRWAGTISLEGHNISSLCNEACGCDSFIFKPICGSDGLNYFSPCYAGCSEQIESDMEAIYNNCTCIPGGNAVSGLCERTCSSLIPYLIVMSISKFAAGITMVPYISIIMRVVEPRDKSMMLGLSGFIMMVVSFPAPVVFGFAIDSCCLVQQSSCVRKGACLFYDNDRFRLILHYSAAFLNFSASFFYFIAWLISRKRNYDFKQDPALATTINGTNISTEQMEEKETHI